jgi:hypothetical protein
MKNAELQNMEEVLRKILDFLNVIT